MRIQKKWIALLALGLSFNTYGMSVELKQEVDHYSQVANINPVVTTALLLESENPNVLDNTTIRNVFDIGISNITKYNNAELAYLSGNDKEDLEELRKFIRGEIKQSELSSDIQERMERYEKAKSAYNQNEQIGNNIKGQHWFVDRSRYGNIRVTSQFAYRSDGMHRALDIGTMQSVGENGKQGEWNVYAVGNAQIVRIQTNPNTDTGLAVWYETVIDGDRYLVSYMHLSTLGNIQVGDRVNPNMKLGTVGQTGQAYGTHLHIQVDRNGVRVNPFRLFGFNPEWDKAKQYEWFDNNGIVVDCTSECLLADEERNQTGEFAVVKCKKHR